MSLEEKAKSLVLKCKKLDCPKYRDSLYRYIRKIEDLLDFQGDTVAERTKASRRLMYYVNECQKFLDTLNTMVVACGYYSSIDKLDGTELKDGEILEIEFPNGTREVHTIHVTKGRGTESEQGCQYGFSYPISQATITIDYNGLKMNMRIEGLKAKQILT